MALANASVRAHEMEANRLRARLGATVDKLRGNLRPRALADEIARGSGLDGLSAASVIDVAVKRNPVPTALIGVGLAAWTFAMIRKRAKNGDASGVSHSLRETASSLGQSATHVFRERAERKRREFVGVAKSHIEAGVSGLADAIEKKVEDVIDIVPEASGARPLVSSAIKVLLSALVEGVLAKA